MKVSLTWLQKYFDEPLPQATAVADALTFHAFEIEAMEERGDDTMLDVKVLPDRAAYALSHRGIAREVGASLNLSITHDPLRETLPAFPTTNELSITIDEPQQCSRYMAAFVKNVKVGSSPAWLKEALQSVGQRSINNVVDATNYVMLNMGQPLHAFDAHKLAKKNGAFSIHVRGSHAGETITTLTNDEYTLPENTLLIVDANNHKAIGIAGVKGGKVAEVTNTTTDIIIESANFEGSSIRKTSQALRLWTDASQRFQNKPSPELAAYGMREVLKLIEEVADGELVGVVDVYDDTAKTTATQPLPVSVTRSKINAVLGTHYTPGHVTNVFERLGFSYKAENDSFTVIPPFERRDIVISEDLVEEVGRILGYDQIDPMPLPTLSTAPDQLRFRGIERIKDFLIERGFTEISTQTFATEGDITLANPLDQTKPALRTTLVENMQEALTRATNVASRVLGPVKEPKLFEIGTIFTKDAEHLSLALGYKGLEGKAKHSTLTEVVQEVGVNFFAGTSPHLRTAEDVIEINLSSVPLEELGKNYEPQKIALGVYRPFSTYPFALRDLAVWTPAGTKEIEVSQLITNEAGKLLARIDLFDRFEKRDDNGTRISYAFRLVFESFERTLSDEDLNPVMEKITATLNARDGYEVR